MSTIIATVRTPMGNDVQIHIIDTSVYKLRIDRELERLAVPSAQSDFINREIEHCIDEQIRYEELNQVEAVSRFCDYVLMLRKLLDNG